MPNTIKRNVDIRQAHMSLAWMIDTGLTPLQVARLMLLQYEYDMGRIGGPKDGERTC